MRIVVVLVLTAALAWAFLKLFPSPTAAHATSDAIVPSEPVAPPGSLAQQATPPAEPEAAEPAPPPAPTVASVLGGELDPSNPFAPITRVDEIPPHLIELGALLAHARWAEVERRLGAGVLREAPARAELVRGAVEALTGRREAALQRARGTNAGAVSAREAELLGIALGVGAFPPQPASASPTPIELGLEMALYAAAAERAVNERRVGEAAACLSRLLIAELDAPWPAEPAALAAWSTTLEEVQARHRWSARGEWPSFDMTVRAGDTLVGIRLAAVDQRSDLSISTGLIERANGLASPVIHAGQVLRIPTDPVSVRVDVEARWLLYLHGSEVVAAWAVGVGREGSETLTGEFVAGGKQKNPTWWPRGRAPVPFGDPENPLGTRWVAWRVAGESADTSYGFHGTKDPESIGQAASEGCIRMLNGRIEELFEILPVGAPISVR